MINIPICSLSGEYSKMVMQLKGLYSTEELQKLLNKQIEEDITKGLWMEEEVKRYRES